MVNMASTMTLECTRIRAEVSPVALMITALSNFSSVYGKVGKGMSKAAKGGMGGMGKNAMPGRLVNCNLSRDIGTWSQDGN
jgi:hypothetical protein